MTQLSDWNRLIGSACWTRAERRVDQDRLRCSACRNEFIPGPAGAAMFTDELNSVRLTVCSLCESRLLLQAAPVLQQRSEDVRKSALDAIGRAQDVLHRSIRLAGNRALGPAARPPEHASEPVRETDWTPTTLDE